MKFLKILVFLALISSCRDRSRLKTPINTDPTISSRDLHAFLKEGRFNVEYYASKEVTIEQRQLLTKLGKQIENNKKLQEYFEKMEQGVKIDPDVSDLNLSKKELNLLHELFSEKAPEKLSGILNIIKIGDRITFKGDGRLSLLDSISVQLNSESASVKEYSLERQDAIDINFENIPDGDSIQAYEYYGGPAGILGLVGLHGSYELLIGKLMPSGSVYLYFYSNPFDRLKYPVPEKITVIIK